MKRIWVFSLSLVAMMSVANLASVQANMLNNLAGSEWGFSGKDDRFVQFRSQGKVSGFGGCNYFHGRYKITGKNIEIGPLAMTKRACIGGRMKHEASFFHALNNAKIFSASHLSLKLKNSHNATLLVLKRRDAD